MNVSIRILVGGPTVSKSDQCIREIRSEFAKNPTGRPIIYLVPEQMTFQQEYQLLKDKQIKGSIRARSEERRVGKECKPARTPPTNRKREQSLPPEEPN